METIYRYSHEIWPSTPVWLPELENLFDACDEIEYDKLLAALPVKLRDA